MARGSTFSRDSWVDAGYAAFERAGLGAVRVEALARELGATKGSFYWHFADRRELVGAIVERWAQRETDALIDFAERTNGPAAERVAALFHAVSQRPASPAGEKTLYRDAEREGVAERVREVSTRRVDYLAGLLEEVGLPAEQARARAVLGVAFTAGAGQLEAIGLEELSDPTPITAQAIAVMLAS